MANIFEGTEPPRWLEAIARPIDTKLTGEVFGSILSGLSNASREAADKNRQAAQLNQQAADEAVAQGKPIPPPQHPSTSFWEQLPQSMHNSFERIQDPLWDIRQKQAQLSFAEQGMQMQAAQQKLNFNAQNMKDAATDQQTLADYVQKYPTHTDRKGADQPAFKTKGGWDAWDKIRQSDSDFDLAQEKSDATTRFKEGITNLYKTKPAEAARISAMGPTAQGFAELSKALPQDVETMKMQSPVGRLQADRETVAKKFGEDSTYVKQIDAAIAEATTNKGKQIYMGLDDQGRPIFQMSEGGAPLTPIGTPTVATKSEAQAKLLEYQNLMKAMDSLEKNLTPGHVGLSGAAGEFVFDRNLAQFIPGVANQKRISARAAVTIFRNQMRRKLSDDKSMRFSKEDREDIDDALPSSGVMESYPDTMAKLGQLREMVKERVATYAKGTGVDVPIWAMSEDQKSKLSPLDIQKAFKSGAIDEKEGMDLLQKYH